MKGAFLYFIFLSLFVGLNFSCQMNGKLLTLEESNLSDKYDYIPTMKDSIISDSSKKYCFKIFHDEHLDLKHYYLVINLNGSIVYSGVYQSSILFSFVKRTKLNTLSVLLYDKEKKAVFSWSNKDVYDFDNFSVKCYDIKLFSEKNIDRSNGFEMKIN